MLLSYNYNVCLSPTNICCHDTFCPYVTVRVLGNGQMFISRHVEEVTRPSYSTLYTSRYKWIQMNASMNGTLPVTASSLSCSLASCPPALLLPLFLFYLSFSPPPGADISTPPHHCPPSPPIWVRLSTVSTFYLLLCWPLSPSLWPPEPNQKWTDNPSIIIPTTPLVPKNNYSSFHCTMRKSHYKKWHWALSPETAIHLPF